MGMAFIGRLLRRKQHLHYIVAVVKTYILKFTIFAFC